MDQIQELQNFRTQLIQEINVTFDRLIERLLIEQQDETEQVNVAREYEATYALSYPTAFFKGKKPNGVIFPNGVRVEAYTWKKVVESILKDCNSIPEKHEALIKLCGKVSGRDRLFLANRIDNMRSPIEIEEGLYMESHYDTESLLRILTTRILEPIKYDYSTISVVIRNDER